MTENNNVIVAIKVRPLIKREKDAKLSALWKVNGNTIEHIDGAYEALTFDHIFDENTSISSLFNTIAKPIVHSAVKGFNGTIFAYGQTSSGKTYTMMGEDNEDGIVRLTANEIFKEIETVSERQFLLTVSYIEIYNEKVNDLLDPTKVDLKIHEDNGNVKVKSKEIVINSVDQIMHYFKTGNKERRTGDTCMNDRSSRSHTILRITIESRNVNECNDTVTVSTLNLVDLAGSERADQTKATGDRLKEGSHINKSLLTLSMVIQKLSDNSNSSHINYRDSKLTRILQTSLGGNAVTTIICTVTPAALEETFYTLNFGTRAKKIKNKPTVNENVSYETCFKRMADQIARLKRDLAAAQNMNVKNNLEQLIKQSEINILCATNIKKKKEVQRRRTWAPNNNNQPIITNEEIYDNNIRPALRKIKPEMRKSENTIIPRTPNISPEELFGEKGVGASPFTERSRLIRTPEFITGRDQRNRNQDDSFTGLRNFYSLEQQYEELQDFTTLEKILYENADQELTERVQKSDIQIKKLTEQIYLLQTENEQLKENINENEVEAKRREDELRSEFIKCQDLIESLKKEKLLEKNNSSNLENKLKDQESQLAGVEYEYEQYKIKQKAREKELVELLNQLRGDNAINPKELLDKNSQLENELELIKRKCIHYEGLIKDSEMELEKNKKHFAEMNVLNENQIEKYMLDLQSQVTENKKLIAVVQELEKDLDCIKGSINSNLVEEVASITEQLESEKTNNVNLTKQLNQIRANEQTNKREKETLTEKLNSIESVLSEKDAVIVNLIETNKVIENESKEFENKYTTLLSEKECLENQNHALEDQHKVLQEKIDELLNQETNSNEVILEEWTAKCNNLKEELTSLKNEKYELENEKEMLENDLTSIQLEMDHLKAKHQCRGDLVIKLESKVEYLTEQQSEYNNLILLNEELVKKYNGLLQEKETETERVKKLHCSFESAKADMTKQLELSGDLSVKLEEKCKELSELNDYVIELKEKCNRYEKQLNCDKNGLASLNECLTKFKVEKSSLENQLSEMKKKLENSETELVTNKEEHMKECNINKCKISNLESTVHNLQEAEKNTQKLLKETRDSVEKVAADRVTAAIAEYDVQLRAKDQKIADWMSRAQELENKILDLKMTMHTEFSFEEQKKRILEYESKLNGVLLNGSLQDRLENENATLKDVNAKLHRELMQLRNDLERKRRTSRQSLHDDKRDLESSSRCASTMTEIIGDPCNCKELQKKITELSKDIKLKECQITGLNIKITSNPLIIEFEELKKKLNRYESEISNLNSEVRELQIKLYSNEQPDIKPTTDDLINSKMYNELKTKYLFYRKLSVMRAEDINNLREELKSLKDKDTVQNKENLKSNEQKNRPHLNGN